MEGTGFSELLRSSTEEILIKSMLDNPTGNSVPTMEMMGFKKLPFRAESEDLFTNWLMNGENPASVTTHHTQQASMRNLENKGIQAIDLDIGKSCHSRLSEDIGSLNLRRKYAAFQDSQFMFAPQVPHTDSDRFKQELTSKRNYCNFPIAEMPNQLQTFLSVSNSSASFGPPIPVVDTVSSVVSMLKDTLEQKKDDETIEETFGDCSYGMLTSQEAACSLSSIQDAGTQFTSLPMLSSVQVLPSVDIVANEMSLELNMKCFRTEENHIKIGTNFQEPSKSESSTAAAILSTPFEVFDGNAQQGLTYTKFDNSGKHIGQGLLTNKTNEFCERIFEDFHLTKKENLTRVDSISSGASEFNDRMLEDFNLTKVDSISSIASEVEKADPTKKRRVERSRKMAEAKEKNSTPLLPLDMQALVKRCENLEKEVRSLKLNLSFMSRKDSEQTKQIDGLQKQNIELTEQKERLSEEIEKTVSNQKISRQISSL